LAQAEVEHEKLVADEEAEEKAKNADAEVEAEKKAIEDKRRDAEKRQ